MEADKRFLPGKGHGLFQNLFLILAAVFLYQDYRIEVLVYAFLIAGLAQCLLILWSVRKHFRFSLKRQNESTAIKTLIKVSVPLLIGNAIYEVNDIIDKQISLGLGEGTVSLLTYGASINEIVTGVVVASISTVLFAHFATWIAEGNFAEIEAKLKQAIEILTIILLPITVICLTSGDRIIEILYGRGNFGHKEIYGTYVVLIGYSVGFVFQAARSNIIKVYYAFQDTTTAMLNGIISVTTNIVLSIFLSRFLGAMGIALATSIAMILSTFLLQKGVKRHLPDFKFRETGIECGKGFVAVFFSAILLWVCKKTLLNTTITIFALLIEIILCFVFYISILVLFKSRSLNFLKSRLFFMIKKVFIKGGW